MGWEKLGLVGDCQVFVCRRPRRRFLEGPGTSSDTQTYKGADIEIDTLYMGNLGDTRATRSQGIAIDVCTSFSAAGDELKSIFGGQ